MVARRVPPSRSERCDFRYHPDPLATSTQCLALKTVASTARAPHHLSEVAIGTSVKRSCASFSRLARIFLIDAQSLDSQGRPQDHQRLPSASASTLPASRRGFFGDVTTAPFAKDGRRSHIDVDELKRYVASKA